MYKSKCLFRNTNGSYQHEASAVESIWAYIHGTETKRTGRYRIRVTKMSAQELIAMGLAPEETPVEFFGLQGSLDRWHESNGWLPLFDWVGDPTSEIREIERDLGKQFKAFVTGIGLEESFSFDLPKPPKAKAVKIPKPPKQPEDKLAEESSESPSDDSPDFEWL